MIETGYWLEQVISFLDELSDQGFQQAQWVEGRNQAIVATFDEAICGLLGDFQFEDLARHLYRAEHVTNEECESMLAHARALGEFALNAGVAPDPRQIVDDPRWRLLCLESGKLRDLMQRILSHVRAN